VATAPRREHRVHCELGEPDIQFHVLPTFVGFADRVAESGPGMSIGPCVLRPQSRESVRLRSPNPADRALFVANSLAEQADVDTLVRGVQIAIRISEATSLAPLVKGRVLPNRAGK
jgi:choline dehydrogenase